MYKKFSIEELSTIQNNVIPHLYTIIQREKYQGVNDFFKFAFKEGHEILFFERGTPSMKFQLEDGQIFITDEIDNIQIQIPADEKGELNRLMIRYISKKQRQIGQKTIEQLLMDAFITGSFYLSLGKPYIVYDIETSLISGEVSDSNFPEYYVGFSLEEVSPGKMQYSCIMKEDLKDFVQKMLEFDGYIIGFNQIYFDNPVSAYNAGFSPEDVKKINEKSLDLYVFFQQLTGRRMGLNKISDSLIGVTKTLDSGADVEHLRKEWLVTNDNKTLKTIQDYCKNDVRMTTLVLLYLIHFKKVDLDNESFSFDIDQFMNLSKPSTKKIPENIQNGSLFM